MDVQPGMHLSIGPGTEILAGEGPMLTANGRCLSDESGLSRQGQHQPARGGHAPDILRVLGEANVLPSSTNPALAHGIAHEVGSVEMGKWADLVLWRPAWFGVKPSVIVKGGFIAAALMGDANASIPTPQPVHTRPMFCAFGGARLATVRGCRSVKKADMAHNAYTPHMQVGAQTYEVRADGQLLTCEPATVLPMAQRYFLF